MVFYRSGEFRPGIEESCNSGFLFYEDLDDCWWTEGSCGVLMTESSNREGTGITSDEKSLLFELLWLILRHWLSRGVFWEYLGDCWWTKESWCGLMTELFNGGGTGIISDSNLFLCEWLSLRLKQRLPQGVVPCLHWFSHVPLLWQLPIPFWSGMMNVIWFCGGVVCLLFCLFIAIKRWDTTFWRDKYSRVWVSVPGIKLITSFLYQYNPNWDLKYDLSERGHYFTVHISYFETKNNIIKTFQYEHHFLLLILVYFNVFI